MLLLISLCVLSWTELGVSDPGDEILHVFFDEVQSRFKKVSIYTSRWLISIRGPEQYFMIDQSRYLDNESASRAKPLL